MSDDARFLKALGKVFKVLRKKDPKLRQGHLAKKARVTQATVSYIERGRKQPSITVMRKLSLALGEKLSTVILLAEQIMEAYED